VHPWTFRRAANPSEWPPWTFGWIRTPDLHEFMETLERNGNLIDCRSEPVDCHEIGIARAIEPICP